MNAGMQAVAGLPRPGSPLDVSLIDRMTERLLSDGYLIVPWAAKRDVLTPLCDDLEPHFARAPFGRGAFYGHRTKRFGSLLRRSKHVFPLVRHPQIYAVVERVLRPACDSLQLNLTQAIEIHPGSPVQVPHRDHDMWGGEKEGVQYMVNVMWALDDFTEVNGATRIWPGSHRRLGDALLPDDQAIPAIMPRGSALLFLGSTLHSGGGNRSQSPRRGLIVSYCLGWLKPWENQWLAYPPDVARSFPAEIAALAGYRQHLPSLGNYEGQCPSVLLKQDGRPDHLSFTDALRPDQQALIAQYYESKGSNGVQQPAVS